MKKNRKIKSNFSFFNTLMFFVTVAFTVLFGILIAEFILKVADNNVTETILVLVITIVISFVFTIIDMIRRKHMVDKPVNMILSATERMASGDFTYYNEYMMTKRSKSEYDIILENLNLLAKELSKMEILKSDFISNVSHEIKTPIMAIQNYAKILSSENLSKEEREKCTEGLNSSCLRLSGLVNDVLSLNKLENQQTKPEFEHFNLAREIEDCIVSFESLIEAKNLQINLDLQKVIVNSSRALINTIINNLMSNAIKFSNDGGEINVAIKVDRKDVVFSVQDNGVGIQSENLSRLFDKFYQEDKSRKSQGNGLGLAIVKEIIDILGGEITVHSEVEKGSTFNVRLNNVIVG